MYHLNDKWETFRTTIEVGAMAVTALGVGIGTFTSALSSRGDAIPGGELLLTIGATILIGVISHIVMDKVEGKLNEKFEAARYEKRREAIRKACKARMFVVGSDKQPRFFSVGE